MEENVLILGAASDMAVAIARKFASSGYNVMLAGRNVAKLETLEADLKVRYKALVSSYQFDALDFESHELFYRNLTDKPDVVICVFGLLGDQFTAQQDFKSSLQIINSNYVGAVSILNVVANDFEAR